MEPTMEVDFPSLVLSEVTGDSDAILEDYSASLDGDDAGSSCWDSSDQCPSSWTNDEDENDLIVDDLDCSDDIDRSPYALDEEEEEEHDGDDDNDLDDENQACYPPWNGGKIGRPRDARRKSCASEDSTTKESEPLNEMEKNRLFWEACLAS